MFLIPSYIMVRVILNFSAEDKEQYRKVKPVRKLMRGKNLHEFPNSEIIRLVNMKFTFTAQVIEVFQAMAAYSDMKTLADRYLYYFYQPK